MDKHKAPAFGSGDCRFNSCHACGLMALGCPFIFFNSAKVGCLFAALLLHVAELLPGVLAAARHPGPQPPAVLHRAAPRPRPGRPPGEPRPRRCRGLTNLSNLRWWCGPSSASTPPRPASASWPPGPPCRTSSTTTCQLVTAVWQNTFIQEMGE